jgi:eukaryotic-like serine/threonine-protein kinase
MEKNSEGSYTDRSPMSSRSKLASIPLGGPTTLRAEGVNGVAHAVVAGATPEPDWSAHGAHTPIYATRTSSPSSPGAARSKHRRRYREGDVIGGKYRLRHVLGEGGMGMVWQARNDVLCVDVAIKFIRQEVSSPELTARLLMEARAAARIDHPSIVRVLDFGESELLDPFIVMELLRGEQLVEAIERKKRFSPATALRTLLPIASALAAAHERKIVHRDLKPENVLLVKNDRGDIVPKLVDFGIARNWSETAGRDASKAGTVLGSPDYMSPEQARGIVNVDGQADIWAFSVVLYETLTGRRPFVGGNYQELVAQILIKEPTPTTEHGAGDAALWSIIERGLAKDCAARWPTMQDMGAALSRWAIANGVEDDVTGTSLAVHWLSDGEQRPLSDRPPLPISRRFDTSRTTAPSETVGAASRRRRTLVFSAVLAMLAAVAALVLVREPLLAFMLRAGAARSAASAPLLPGPDSPPPATTAPDRAALLRSEPSAEPGRSPAQDRAVSAPSAEVAPPPQRATPPRRAAPAAATAKPGAPRAAMPMPSRPNF